MDLAGGRLDGVAAGQDRGLLIEKSCHLIGITTGVTHVFRHDEFDIDCFGGLREVARGNNKKRWCT